MPYHTINTNSAAASVDWVSGGARYGSLSSGFVHVSVDCEVTHYNLLGIRSRVRKTIVLPILSSLLNLILLFTIGIHVFL